MYHVLIAMYCVWKCMLTDIKMLLLMKCSTYNIQNVNCHVRYFTIHVAITQENSFVYSVGTGNGLGLIF